MRHIRLIVQYDGTDYSGYQIQPQVPTVQADLQDALSCVLGHEVGVIAASRTDAGVHAVGQTVSLRTDRPIPVPRLIRAVNNALPPAISIADGDEVSDTFHARHDAVSKLYLYRILNREQPSPFIGRYAWHLQAPLDMALMTDASSHLIGSHDFSAFQASGASTTDAVRNLQGLDCRREGDIIEIRALGDGFLYMMVRIIAGTLVEVGRGRIAPEAVRDIVACKDRSQAGPTAPPQGLSLVRVDY